MNLLYHPDIKECGVCPSDGYTAVGETCYKCPSNCSVCSERTCEECMPGYTRLDSGCELCSNVYTGCLECVNNNCLACAEKNYYDSTTRECVSCSLFSEQCDECDEDSCTKCQDGYGVNERGCMHCKSNCVQCDNGECQICNGTYTPYENSCYNCSKFELCEQCNSTNCIKCVNGESPVDSKCYNCSGYTNCANCDATKCISCQQNCYLENANCKLCSTKYEGCSLCDLNTCKECAEGYFMTETGICSKCVTNCAKCSNTTHCETCEEGFMVIGNACGTCESYGECSQCNSEQCVICKSGYFNNNGYCYRCVENCLDCINNNTCTKCSADLKFKEDEKNCTECPTTTNYFVDEKNTCKKCKSECTKCTTLDKCSECITGYFVDSTSHCVDCVTKGCLTCDAIKCLSCALGEVVDSLGKCSICSVATNSANCVKCHNEGSSVVCDACKDGFFMDDTKTKCITCDRCGDLGCQIATQKCYNCENSTDILIDGICKEMGTCKTRGDNGKCSECIDNYILVGSKCVQITTETSNVVMYNGKTILASDVNCSAIDSTKKTCTLCDEDYYINNGMCMQCTDIYDSCISCGYMKIENYKQVICSTCTVGYYPDIYCKQCTDMNGCKMCVNYLNENETSTKNCTESVSGRCTLCEKII
ncbi:hypothetical protein EIN_069580, partial [Entamoeba invadens IP1]